MSLSVTQKNVLRLLKQSLDKVLARHVARCRKRALYRRDTKLSEPTRKTIDTLFSALAAKASPPNSQWGLSEYMPLLGICMKAAYTDEAHAKQIERAWLRDLWKHAAEYEMLSQMPLPKREYRRRGQQTLIERRADAVDEKIRMWERKLKLAKTKLTAYRKKQKYYAKKGTVA